jgi:hypothetical protein
VISKVVSARSFYSCCKYVCMDSKRAVVLGTEGVRGHNYKLMAKDFLMQQQLRPSKQGAVFHSILSFYPGERPTDEKMIAIAREYLQKIGMVNTQYSITKHIDKEHLHMHLIANKVNKMGQAIREGWIGLRSKKVSEALTLKYEMRQELGKNLKLTQMAALNKYDATKYKIYEAVSEALPKCKNFLELQEQLHRLGIGMQLKYSSQQGHLQGISFKMGDYCFKGSNIDRGLSAKKLERNLEINYDQILNREIKRHL